MEFAWRGEIRMFKYLVYTAIGTILIILTAVLLLNLASSADKAINTQQENVVHDTTYVGESGFK